MAYRNAKCIELHETHTTITVSDEGYTLSSPAARSKQANRPAFLIRSSDVERLFERLGLNLLRRTSSGSSTNREETMLPLVRAYHEIPAGEPGFTILSLECDVIGPNLVDIRIEWRGEGAPPETPGEIETITHSGTFTIWWAADRPVDPAQLFAQAEAHPPIPVESELVEIAEDEVESISINIQDLGEIKP